MSYATKFGLALGALHLAAFTYVFHIVTASEEAQIQLLYVPFFFVDFPMTILDFVGIDKIARILRANGHRELAYIFYSPLLVHGILGSLWWFWVGRTLSKQNSDR